MKHARIVPVLCFGFFLAFTSHAAAASSAPVDPMAVSADLGMTGAGIFVGAVAASVSYDFPLAHSLAISLDPSVYWASGTTVTSFQLTVVVAARFYVMSLLITDPEKQAQWGPFVSAGVALAWARELTGSSLDALSFGPNVAVGYRLVFGDRGIFLEPSVGWMALYGGRFDAGGASAVTNAGISGGFFLGYRF